VVDGADHREHEGLRQEAYSVMGNRIPHSSTEVRFAFQRLEASVGILTDGTLGQYLIGQGANLYPVWIDPVTLTAGSGLAGGGDISADRTFDLDINSLSVATIVAGDFVPFWDITATATNKKTTFANFEAALTHDNLIAGTIVSHDTTATGANLTSLTDNSIVNTLHRHSELSASDGTPDASLAIDATGKVGINVGASGPQAVLHIALDTGTFNSEMANPYGLEDAFTMTGDDAFVVSLAVARTSQPTTRAAGVIFRKARGTIESPSTCVDDDIVGGFFFQAHDGTAVRGHTAKVQAFVDGTVSTDVVPMRIDFSTSPDTDDNIKKRMSIRSSGTVLFYSTTASGINPTTYSTIGPMILRTDSPGLWFNSYNVANDKKLWLVITTGTEFLIRTVNDAGAATLTPLTLEHNGNMITAGSVTIGLGTAGVDYTLTFDGENSNGVITWMEDEDRFDFADHVHLTRGVLYLTETTTPSAITGSAAIYTKNTNTIYFQDGAGAEHLLHGDAFSNIWFHGASTVEVTISTQNALTIIDSFTVVGKEDDLSHVIGSVSTNNLTLSSNAGGEYEISFHASITATGGADKEMIVCMGITLATALDITDVTDNTITPIVITSTAHGLENGDMVEIVDVLGNTAANGSFIVDSKADNTFVIVALDGSATTGNGDYDAGSPTGDVTIKYPGNMIVHREVRGASIGAISATGIHDVLDSEKIAVYVANLVGITNLTVAAISLDAFRIGD